MWKNMLLAYRGWFAIVAIIVSSFALANFLFRVFDVGLSQIAGDVLLWYRQIVHGLFDYVLIPFHINLTQTTKDLFTLWAMVGGLVSRTVNYIYARGYPHDFAPNVIGVGVLDRLATDRKAFRGLSMAIITFFAWPYCIVRLAMKPYLMTAGGLGLYISSDKRTRDSATFDTLQFDARHIFLVYIATLLAVLVAFFALNALLPSVS